MFCLQLGFRLFKNNTVKAKLIVFRHFWGFDFFIEQRSNFQKQVFLQI